jgi:hypothetical protein
MDGKNWSSVGNYEYLRVERVRMPEPGDFLPLPGDDCFPLPIDNFLPLPTVAAPQQDSPDIVNTVNGYRAPMYPTGWPHWPINSAAPPFPTADGPAPAT